MQLKKFLGKKKLFVSALLTATLVVVSCAPAVTPSNPYGSFSLEILNNTNIGLLSNSHSPDLSGIKIDVYDSVLESHEAAVGAYVYAHHYSCSTYTGTDGAVVIKKPSELFLVIIDLTTLPVGVGIDKEQVFYADALQTSDALSISDIDNFAVFYDSAVEGGIRVDIFNAVGEQIKADYAVTPDILSGAKPYLLDRTYQVSGSVAVGGLVKAYQHTIQNTSDPVDVIAGALEAGEITKEEALDLYLGVCESKQTVFCTTMLITQLAALYADTTFFGQLSLAKQEALEKAVVPSRNHGAAHYRGDAGTGYFDIYYDYLDQSGLITTAAPQIIKDIYNAFVATHNTFVNSLGYIEPVTWYESGSPIHKVEIYTANPDWPISVDGHANANITTLFIRGKSDLSTSFHTTEQLDQARAVIAHEYFHSINGAYNPDVPSWFAESFANWAIARQYGPVGLQYSMGWINGFLEWPMASLENNNNYQKYGAALLPIYIYTYCGSSGDAVIKSVFTEIASPSFTDVYSAIDDALAEVSFGQVFAEFWANNYFPKLTYSEYATKIWLDKPGITQYYSINNLPNGAGPYSVDHLASQFMEFGLPSPGNDTVGVTINVTSGMESTLQCFLLLRTSIGVFAVYDFTSRLSPMYSVVVAGGYSYTDGCIVPVNYGTNGSVSYELTITRR